MTLRRLPLRACRLFATLLLALGMLSAPAGRSASHDPLALAAAEVERHAALAAEIAEHGHIHDEGDLDEQSPGHTHGHDSADHLHDKAGAPPAFFGQASLAAREMTLTATAQTGRDASLSGLKRPPRPSFAA